MFIVAEGMDGAGKTTQLTNLAQRLADQGYDVVRTREPGGSPLAETLRNLVVCGEPGRMDSATELLLFTAARRDHVHTCIKPALERGALVLCDRYLDSTHALQGAAGVPAHDIDALHDTYVQLQPDWVLFFDLDPQVSLDRALARGGDTSAENRMERKGADFHHRVGAILQERAALPNRIRIDANGTIEEVAARLDAVMAMLLANTPAPKAQQTSPVLQPSELVFFAKEGTLVGGTELYIYPKDEDSPLVDNLRTEDLAVAPDWLDAEEMENTWFVADKTPQEVREELEALGYTYDESLDF